MAALSEGTAFELRKHVEKIDFIGSQVKTSEIALEFAAHCENQSVLFPMAIDSLQSIQKSLSFSTKVINLYVYKTVELKVHMVPTAEVVVFTSPSNVRGFLDSCTWNAQKQMAVSIGDSTAYELKNHGIHSTIAFGYSELSLADTVLNLC